MAGLGLKTFLSAVEMVQQALRMKREDFWSPQVCKLKYVSFTSEFPEVNEAQFFWACEQWIQSTGAKDFPRVLEYLKTCPKTDPNFKQLIAFATQNFDTFEDTGSTLDDEGGRRRVDRNNLDQ